MWERTRLTRAKRKKKEVNQVGETGANDDEGSTKRTRRDDFTGASATTLSVTGDISCSSESSCCSRPIEAFLSTRTCCIRKQRIKLTTILDDKPTCKRPRHQADIVSTGTGMEWDC